MTPLEFSRETSCGRQNSLVVPRTLISWYPCLVYFLPTECVLDLQPVSKQKHTANVIGYTWLHICNYITKNCNGFPARRLFLSYCPWKSKLPCSKPYGDCHMTRSWGLPTIYSQKEIEVLCLAPCKELNYSNLIYLEKRKLTPKYLELSSLTSPFSGFRVIIPFQRVDSLPMSLLRNLLSAWGIYCCLTKLPQD